MVFPAPLGPRNPTISPFGTVKRNAVHRANATMTATENTFERRRQAAFTLGHQIMFHQILDANVGSHEQGCAGGRPALSSPAGYMRRVINCPSRASECNPGSAAALRQLRFEPDNRDI